MTLNSSDLHDLLLVLKLASSSAAYSVSSSWKTPPLWLSLASLPVFRSQLNVSSTMRRGLASLF